MFIKFDVNAVLVAASARLLLAGKVQALSTPGNPSRFLMARTSRRQMLDFLASSVVPLSTVMQEVKCSPKRLASLQMHCCVDLNVLSFLPFQLRITCASWSIDRISLQGQWVLSVYDLS